MNLVLSLVALVALTVIVIVLFKQYLIPKKVHPSFEGNFAELDYKLAKKYDQVNLERQRIYPAIMAFFLVMIYTYVMVEHKTYDKVIVEEKKEVQKVVEEIVDIPVTEMPPPEPPQPKVSMVLEVVKDDEIIEEKPKAEEKPEEKLTFDMPEEIVEEVKEEKTAPQIHIMVEQDSEPAEGKAVFDQRLNNRINEVVSKMNTDGVSSGVIMLQFVILENGQVSNMQVLQGIHPSVDKVVAQEFVKLAPKWQPGKIQGQAVRQLMQYPVMLMFE